MENKLFLLIFSILFISFVFAETIYSGESINITLDKPYTYYSIIGNSSPVYLDIIQNGTNIQITFNKYMKDDSFEIVFFDTKKEVITQYSGGGHSRTIIKYVNNTEYVEVPEYISVPNNTIEYVQNNTTEEKIVNIGEINLFLVILGLLLVGLIIGVLIYFMRKSSEKNTNERRLE